MRGEPSNGQSRMGAMRATVLFIVAAVTACAGPFEPSSVVPSSSEPSAPSATHFSTDNGSWEFIDDPALFPGSIQAMASSGSALVAGGIGCTAVARECTGALWTSDDGQEWTRVVDFPYGEAYNGISAIGFGPSGWVAFADGGFAWLSANGDRWTVVPGASFDPLADGGPTYSQSEAFCCSATVRGVAEVAGTYVAVGAVTCHKCLGRAAIWRSEDGEAWKRVPYQAVFEGAPLSAVAAIPSGRLVAVGGRFALASDDLGVTWAAAPAFGAGSVTELALVGDDLLAAGFPGDAYEGAYWRSSDGVTWEPLEVDLPFPEPIPRALGSMGGAVIISGTAREPDDPADWGFTAISSDLATWQPVATSDGRPFLIWSFAQVDGLIVAAGNFAGEAEQLPAGVWILRSS
jgi:hypothetical protein